MAEYIDRDEALNAILGCDADVCETLDEWGECEWGLSRELINEAIASIPQAEVVPVRYGKWEEGIIWRKDCFWICSECKFPSEASAAPKLYHYCPNCGAKMEGFKSQNEEV